MRSLTVFLILTVALFSCQKDIKQELIDTLNQTKGNFALAYKNLQTGEEILINEHRVFHAASTMKTPVLIELYKQCAAKKMSLQDSLLIKTEFNSIVDGTFTLSPDSDSEKELYNYVGKKRTLAELKDKMIINSSNLATNLLIEILDAKKVTQTMRDIGARDILVLRGVEDGKAFRAGLNNVTSAYDLMVIFTAIGEEKVINQGWSRELIWVLKDQEYNTIIPAKLPKDVEVAHKTGWITGVNHDSALVTLPDGRKYVLVLMSDSVEDEEAAIENMATASKMIYDYFNL